MILVQTGATDEATRAKLMGFTIQEDPASADLEYVEEQLIEFADHFTGPRNRKKFGSVLRDPSGNVVGGVAGDIVWDWLQAGTLWVTEGFRRQGYGHELLARAEMLAGALIAGVGPTSGTE